jgi:hypothetical protein
MKAIGDAVEVLPRRRRVLSYGGGVDSFAMLLDAAARGELPDAVVFVDVGDGGPDLDPTVPAEWPGTYQHMREVVMPLCRRLGLRFEWLDGRRYPVRDAASLFEWLDARGQIPVAGPNRICTRIAKVERFERWLADTYPGERVEVWIGFEAGEEDRADKDPNAGKPSAIRINRFPLIEGRICRCRAVELVSRSGYPVPRKSACVFCPYGSMTDWQVFARELPGQFAEVAGLEARKPPTKAGHKLSIMGYRTVRDAEGAIVEVKAPPIGEWIQRKARGSRKPCLVCGAKVRATKATGCGYLTEPAPA